jgi:hypothetical protein
MKVSQLGIIAVMLVVIAVAMAGCTGSTPAAPGTTGGSPSGGAAPSEGAPAAATSAASGGALNAASVFGGLNYEWAEYKMTSGTGAEKMTIYMKYNHKTGKCTMRFEGAGMEGMPSEMDCSATGGATKGQTAGNPNEVKSDVQLKKIGTETVTVGAGTFVADKYQATFEGSTATYWVASGKPLLKMEGSSAGQGGAVMELNAWG